MLTNGMRNAIVPITTQGYERDKYFLTSYRELRVGATQ